MPCDMKRQCWLLAGPASSLVLGVGGWVFIDRMPESDLRKNADIDEDLDE